MAVDRIINLAPAAVPMVLAVLALRPVTDRELAAFSRRYWLPAGITSPALPRAIARSRGLRLLGAAMGFALPALVRAVTHDALNTGSALLWGAAGYLGGALAAALMPVARPGEPLRTATLVPRRARDYLPLRTLVLPAIAIGVGLLSASVFALTPHRPDASSGATVIGPVVLSVMAALVMVVGVHRVVRRPQPVPDGEVLAVDDALRSQGVHLVVGTGNVIGALAATAITLELGNTTSVSLLESVCTLIAIGQLLVVVLAWPARNGAWRVRPKVPV